MMLIIITKTNTEEDNIRMTSMMMTPPCRTKGIDGLHEGGKVETVSYEKPGNMILTQGAEVCTGLELKVSDSHYYFNMGEEGPILHQTHTHQVSKIPSAFLATKATFRWLMMM